MLDYVTVCNVEGSELCLLETAAGKNFRLEANFRLERHAFGYCDVLWNLACSAVGVMNSRMAGGLLAATISHRLFVDFIHPLLTGHYCTPLQL